MNAEQIDEIALPENEALARLLPRLMGKVFHVSKAQYYEPIVESGAILPNDGRHGSSFGASKISYFKNRGCVSVFDYRDSPKEKFQQFMGRCAPTLPASPESPIVIFYLGEAAISRLLPWSGWEIDREVGEDVLPYLEAGHPGSIPLTEIDEILRVSITEQPNSLISIMRKARNNAR